MMQITMNKSVVVYITWIVFVASILHSILPPWENLAFSPRFQKIYRVMVYFIGFTAVNLRSVLYKSLSTDEGRHPSLHGIYRGKVSGAGQLVPGKSRGDGNS